MPPALNAADPQCRNAVMRLESWKIPCAGSDNARETEFGDGGRARTLRRPRLQWGETASPLPRYEASPLPRYEASPLPRIADHCQLSALPITRHHPAPCWHHSRMVQPALRGSGIATWRHCDLVALRPGGIATMQIETPSHNLQGTAGLRHCRQAIAGQGCAQRAWLYDHAGSNAWG
jgi:hypothetical protein